MRSSAAIAVPFARIVRVLAGVVVFLGATVLVIGWMFDVQEVRSVLPGAVAMKAWTAIGLVSAASCLLVVADGTPSPGRRRLSVVLALVPLALGVVVLSQHVFDLELGIEELLFTDADGRAANVEHPGRFAPTTAVNFILIGAALLLLDRRIAGWRLSELLAVPVALVDWASLVGYLYDIPAFYGPESAAKMAIHTAAGFELLAVCVLIARPTGRLLQLATTKDPAGIMLRRLLPVAFLAPLLLGWVRIQAMRAGIVGDEVGTWWLSAATMVGLAAIVVWSASKVQDVERDRRQTLERFERAFAEAPIGMLLVDTDGRTLRANRAMTEMLDRSEQELSAGRFGQWTHPDDVEGDRLAFEELRTDKRPRFRREKRYVRPDGSVVWAEVSASAVRDDGGRILHFVAHVQDITERKRAQEELVRLANHDALTGLWNRRRLEQELEQQIARSRRYDEQAAILILDLDGFKHVNDQLGHQAGDELLKAVARTLTAALRATDVVARLGGDEFAVLLRNSGEEKAAVVAAELRRALAATVIPGGPAGIAASFGTAVIDASTPTCDHALRQADLAMYADKRGAAAWQFTAPERAPRARR